MKWKHIRNFILGLIGLAVAILVALQIVLRPSVLTGIIGRVAGELVPDGNVSLGEVRAHVIKSFPYLSIDAKDVALTYPHGLFAGYDIPGDSTSRPRRNLLRAGYGEDIDTLLSVRKLSVSVNYVAFLKGSYHIHGARLERPRIFAHQFDSTAANWNILPLGGGKDKDTASTLPPIRIDRVDLSDRPLIVYTSLQDTVHAMIGLRRLALEGSLNLETPEESEASLAVDSMMVAGRLPGDTLALRLDHLRMKAGGRRVVADARATTHLRTESFGRFEVPVSVEADASFPEHGPGELAASFERLKIGLSAINLEGKGDVLKKDDGCIDMDVEASVEDCPVGDIVKQYRENFEMLRKFDKDAKVSLSASAKGTYGGGSSPVISVEKLLVDVAGGRLRASARIEEAFGKDPLIEMKGNLNARVDSLTSAFTEGIDGTGTLRAKLSGRARLSQLSLKKIGSAAISCELSGEDLSIEMPKDSLRAFLPRIEASVKTRGNEIDPLLKKGARVLALKADADTLDFSIRDMFVRSGKLLVLMQNSADVLSGLGDRSSIMGLVRAERLEVRDDEGLAADIDGNEERFRYEPATPERQRPRLSLASKSRGLNLDTGENSLALNGFSFDASAVRHVRRALPPRDSLARRMRPQAVQDDFASADISINLSDNIRQYFRNWDLEGNLSLDEGNVRLPVFPAGAGVSKVTGSFDNDTLSLRSIRVTAGESDLSASAELTGIRRALVGRGRSRMRLKANVTSDFLNLNELLSGYSRRETQPEEGEGEEGGGGLIVIPSNLDVDFSLEASCLVYDSLDVNWAAADVVMKDRTVQLTNALAATNMGDIYFEGFYSTRSREDIKAGFDLRLADITAEKVIALFPAIDTIVPLLKSFAGDLNCEFTATASLDTTMNIILPTVNGVMKISGKDLALQGNDQLTKLMNLLKFKNREQVQIDKMSVTGIIQDDVMEVFPFILDVDRYLLATSGYQHLEKDFDYHISVIRSPLVLKFGVNAWGNDYGNAHFALARAKYRSVNVPVYTKELDLAQISLVAAIHNIFEKGVQRAVEENRNNAVRLTEMSGELPGPADEDGGDSGVRTLEGLVESINESVNSRRSALREEILALENDYGHI